MDYEKNYSRWIEGLTKDQFDEFIKIFIKIYWNVDTVSIVDGKGDGGIDVKIFKNKKNRKVPLQVTIDKNLYGKLEKDLVKIEKLIENYGYESSFYFYYSRTAAENKIDNLIEKARSDYSITLEIFDGKKIASYLCTPSYLPARNKLKEFLGDLFLEEQIFDEKDKLYSDFLSYGNQSLELKERFIYSFLLNELYESENNTLTKEELQNKINKEFNISENKGYCNRLISNLSTAKKVKIVDKYNVKLIDSEKLKIKSIKEDSNILEREFLTNLQKILVKYDSDLDLKTILKKLNQIYAEVSEVDVKEINESIESVSDVRSTIKDFCNFIISSCEESVNASDFLKEIFTLCGENGFIHRVSAGNLFKKLIDNSEFLAYTRRQQKEVFIDTPVLIYLLLAMHEPTLDYDNNKFKIARDLFSLIQTDFETASYSTTHLYIIELAGYIKSAIRLIPIEEQGLFKSLGGSNNEIINLYLKTKEENLFEGGLHEYIESLGITIQKIEKNDRFLEQYLIRLFKDNNIHIDDVYPYNTDVRNRENSKTYERIEKTLIDIYSELNIQRRKRSLTFDSLLFSHIYLLNEDLVDPTILTWDNTFIEFRKRFQPSNPNLRYWHLFRPGKYLDHVSLIKFKINGNSISNEIMSLIETDFEIVTRVKKLADVLSSIVDLKSVSGTKLTKGLSDIRDKYIYKINSTREQDILDAEVPQPVDEMITNIVSHFDDGSSKLSFEHFTKALQNEEFVSDLLIILKKEIDTYFKTNKLSKVYLSKVSKLIENYS